ncbi:hypothetical protein L5876_07415 [Hyphobacterium sp. SN044]|uniref:hypothetical protein n=1 Tax=Hyphobacterium sp. SN044 TaxID=2912575 RepID=UPI001F234282|nr:hypothetical protein [Hyphobacterium sp. SN044]MCF8879637.1 hypothetical protein [Hyphobacterium sp. SN044]
MNRASGIRFALFQILMAIFFVSAILIADNFWSDTVIQWAAVVYVLAMGLVSTIWFMTKVNTARGGDRQ